MIWYQPFGNIFWVDLKESNVMLCRVIQMSFSLSLMIILLFVLIENLENYSTIVAYMVYNIALNRARISTKVKVGPD